MVKEFIYIEETDANARRIVINVHHVTAFHLGKKEGEDLLKIYLRADETPYNIEGKDARRIFDELKIHLTREGLL